MPLSKIGFITVVAISLLALPTRAGTIDLIVNAYATYNDVVTPIPTKCGDAMLTPVEPGSIITYEIAVAVDDSAGSAVPGNMGLATIVFNVLNAGACSGYQMPQITAAESGYLEIGPGVVGGLRDVTDCMYVNSGTTAYPGYDGGWGFTNSGLPIGGNVTSQLCNILGANDLAPLVWTADVNTTYPGLQPRARLGVGIGTYTFPWDDPSDAAGKQGGFGQDLSNVMNVIPGDGHWLMFRSWIDTSGWAGGADYGWNVVPTNGAVFSPTIDYNFDAGGGFRIAVPAADMAGDSFAFTLIPEPACLILIGLAAAGAVRRRPIVS